MEKAYLFTWSIGLVTNSNWNVSPSMSNRGIDLYVAANRVFATGKACSCHIHWEQIYLNWNVRRFYKRIDSTKPSPGLLLIMGSTMFRKWKRESSSEELSSWDSQSRKKKMSNFKKGNVDFHWLILEGVIVIVVLIWKSTCNLQEL